MKKKLLKYVIMLSAAVIMLAVSCTKKVNYNQDVVTLTKGFYNDYLKAINNNSNDEAITKIKTLYMTDVLVDELELRTWELEADAITGVQDATGFNKYLEIEKGQDDSWAVATFTVPSENNEVAKNIYKFDIHYRTIDDKKLMDTYDFTWTEIDEYGTKGESVYKTRYANKEVLTEEDKKAMQSIRNYYEDLFAEGYIS